MDADTQSTRLIVLMPVYCDWKAARIVCDRLDSAVAGTGLAIQVVLVDDGTPAALREWWAGETANLSSIDVLVLRRNVGHQRAIAVGLCYVADHIGCDAVVVMDSDGEDKPEDAIRLVHRWMSGERTAVVFAARGKRLENTTFRAGYHAYRIVHRLLTGISVRVGNFSVIPFDGVRRLVAMSELWNHYAAAVFRSKLAYEVEEIDRAPRVHGESRMNFVALVAHGVSAMATFSEVVATRILLSIAVLAVLVALAAASAIGIRLTTNWAIPGWTSVTVGLLVLLTVQLAATAFSLMLSVLASRAYVTSPPGRDYAWLIDKSVRLASQQREK